MSTKLPDNLALDKEQEEAFKEKIKHYKSKEVYSDKNGVIIAKHMPFGLNEPQIKQYFEQFGEVTKLRLSRSKKTGASKNYAFVEFASDVVARIVADTMKDYLMFRKRFTCKYIPSDEVHPNTFVGSNRIFKKPKAHMISIKRHNTSILNTMVTEDGSLSTKTSNNKKNLKTTKYIDDKSIMKKRKLISKKGISSNTNSKTQKKKTAVKLNSIGMRNNKLKKRLKERLAKINKLTATEYTIECQRAIRK